MLQCGWPFSQLVCIYALVLLNILNILPPEEYHKSLGESLQTVGCPMTPRTLASMCDGGENSPGLFLMENASYAYFSISVLYTE